MGRATVALIGAGLLASCTEDVDRLSLVSVGTSDAAGEAKDAELADGATPDLSFPDLGLRDVGLRDLGHPDLGPTDAGMPDLGPPLAPEPERRVFLHSPQDLFRFDGLELRLVGRFRAAGDEAPGQMFDLAVNAEGRMFGGDANRNIWSINESTAECSLLFRAPVAAVGMGIDAQGRLLVASASSVLRLDVETGTVLEEVDIGPYLTSGDLLGLPDGSLHVLVSGARGRWLRVAPDGQPSIEASLPFRDAYGLVEWSDGLLAAFGRNGGMAILDVEAGTARSVEPVSLEVYGAGGFAAR